MTAKTQQWEGEVEVGGHGIRVGGDDLNLADVIQPGDFVRVTITWPEIDSEGQPLYRLLGRSVGTLPTRPSAAGAEPAAEAAPEEVGEG